MKAAVGPAEPAGGADGPGPGPLPELPDALLSGYLDAALATLRAADQADLPGPLRQYQTWTPKRLRHQRVLSLVRRTLDLDQSFRKAVDERVLQEEEALARLVRAGRHAEALASGETPEAVARVGLGLGGRCRSGGSPVLAHRPAHRSAEVGSPRVGTTSTSPADPHQRQRTSSALTARSRSSSTVSSPATV